MSQIDNVKPNDKPQSSSTKHSTCVQASSSTQVSHAHEHREDGRGVHIFANETRRSATSPRAHTQQFLLEIGINPAPLRFPQHMANAARRTPGAGTRRSILRRAGPRYVGCVDHATRRTTSPCTWRELGTHSSFRSRSWPRSWSSSSTRRFLTSALARVRPRSRSWWGAWMRPCKRRCKQAELEQEYGATSVDLFFALRAHTTALLQHHCHQSSECRELTPTADLLTAEQKTLKQSISSPRAYTRRHRAFVRPRAHSARPARATAAGVENGTSNAGRAPAVPMSSSKPSCAHSPLDLCTQVLSSPAVAAPAKVPIAPLGAREEFNTLVREVSMK